MYQLRIGDVIHVAIIRGESGAECVAKVRELGKLYQVTLLATYSTSEGWASVVEIITEPPK